MPNTFLHITEDMKLSDLNELVGSKNVPYILNVNGLERSKNIGEQYYEKCENIASDLPEVSWKRKSEILNLLSQDTDVFEYAAIQSNNGWKILSNNMSFNDYISIPETITLTRHDEVMGDGIPVTRAIYRRTMDSLESKGYIDPSVFNDFSTIRNTSTPGIYNKESNSSVFQMFNVPWGDIIFYSKLSNESKDIPVYPEQLKDGRTANYDMMESTLYQYEPWFMYNSNNGRSITLDFHMHRQMWSGDERDGKANELIRFMEASTYPRYNGSVVNSDIVTLYIKGYPFISGILSSCEVQWTGPIGLDGFYLEFTVSITIQEVSTRALNYDVVKSLPLIG